MKTKESAASPDKKSIRNNTSAKSEELHTDFPLSEKDEVKEAEKRTNTRPLRRRL
jgi:hypothetical protein